MLDKLPFKEWLEAIYAKDGLGGVLLIILVVAVVGLAWVWLVGVERALVILGM